MKFGDSANQIANILDGGASIANSSANLVGTFAGFERREEDWELQKNMAQHDVEQIKCQLEALHYQQKVAQNEVDLLNKNVEQEQKVEKFLKTKFTNEQLYQWMVGKLSTLYFQSYQLAYELARQAQTAWQYELGTEQESRWQAYLDRLKAAGYARQPVSYG